MTDIPTLDLPEIKRLAEAAEGEGPDQWEAYEELLDAFPPSDLLALLSRLAAAERERDQLLAQQAVIDSWDCERDGCVSRGTYEPSAAEWVEAWLAVKQERDRLRVVAEALSRKREAKRAVGETALRALGRPLPVHEREAARKANDAANSAFADAAVALDAALAALRAPEPKEPR